MTLPLAGWLALFLPLAATPPVAPGDPVEAVTKTGQVVELTSILKARALVVDPEPISRQFVLEEPGGTITPLLSDEASRALFLDERLRNRPIEIHGRRHPGLPYLQVMTFQIDDQGRWRTPEYFCEVCTISVRYPQTCPCCQGPMELRMKP
jgi:hypothetical protein